MLSIQLVDGGPPPPLFRSFIFATSLSLTAALQQLHKDAGCHHTRHVAQALGSTRLLYDTDLFFLYIPSLPEFLGLSTHKSPPSAVETVVLDRPGDTRYQGFSRPT